MYSQATTEKQPRKYYSRILFALFLLFNPDISVIDILPDFIAYFILAKTFEEAADCAPYFEEARIGFLRLGWINFAKIFGLFLISAERSHNSFNNDIIPLVSFVFAIAEIMVLLPTVNNIFEALFRLGQRSDAEALIKPFGKSNPEALRSLTQLFVICKCAVYSFPYIFLLTKTNEGTHGTQIITISSTFPPALLISLFLGLVFGIVWLTCMRKYVKAVKREGRFAEALEELASLNEPERENKRKLRKMKFGTTMLFVSALFSFEFSFSNYSEINILPHFIYGAVLTYSLVKLVGEVAYKRAITISGAVYCAVSAVFYYFQTKFLVDYGYEALLRNVIARDKYNTVRILAVAEMLSLTVLLAFGLLAMREFVYRNTGLSRDSKRYGRLEKEFHGGMMARVYVLFGTALLAAFAKCAKVFVNGALKIIFTNPNDVTQPTIIAPSVAWFGVVIVTTAVIYAGFSLYYSSVLKEELEHKYSTY